MVTVRHLLFTFFLFIMGTVTVHAGKQALSIVDEANKAQLAETIAPKISPAVIGNYKRRLAAALVRASMLRAKAGMATMGLMDPESSL